jgi:hypothetical protein
VVEAWQGVERQKRMRRRRGLRGRNKLYGCGLVRLSAAWAQLFTFSKREQFPESVRGEEGVAVRRGCSR